MVDAERQIMELTGGIHAEARFTFTLTPGKPLVRFGADGYSRKGSAPTAASYYLTFSRLSVDGRLRLGAEAPLSVSGQAWMDHEYSSSQLDPEQVGWDWLSAQFHDGRELMFYALRRRDGSIDPASTLTWIDRDGGTSRADYRWEAIDHWTSPATGATYPSRIRLTTTDPLNGRETVLLVVPFHRDQEIPGDLGGVTYWEGACRILAVDGETELGSAYLELTGYDRPVDVVR
jgi:predicted secreted hydrolase